MIVAMLKCRMCGHEFELEIIDDDDPKEKHAPRYGIRCPNPRCGSGEISVLRKIRKSLSRR